MDRFCCHPRIDEAKVYSAVVWYDLRSDSRHASNESPLFREAIVEVHGTAVVAEDDRMVQRQCDQTLDIFGLAQRRGVVLTEGSRFRC